MSSLSEFESLAQFLLQQEGEVLLYRHSVIKLNRRNHEENRIIALTPTSLYSIKGSDPRYLIKRRIQLKAIIGVVLSTNDPKSFLLKVPSEYDYRYVSSDREEIVEHIQDLITRNVMNPVSFTVWRTARNLAGFCKQKRGTEPTAVPTDAEIRWSPGSVQELGTGRALQLSYYPGVPVPEMILIEQLCRHPKRVSQLMKLRDALYVASSYVLPTDLPSRKAIRDSIYLRLQYRHLTSIHTITEGAREVTVYTEYCSRGDLAALLCSHPHGLDPDVYRHISIQVANALKHLHERNVVFRDLRPAKVLFSDSFDVKLNYPGFDSKIVESLEECREEYSEYLSPETSVSKATDWWSFGILLHEMVFGSVPDSVFEVLRPISILPQSFSNDLSVSEDVKNLIIRLLTPNQDIALRVKTDSEILAHSYFALREGERIRATDKLSSILKKLENAPMSHRIVIADNQFQG